MIKKFLVVTLKKNFFGSSRVLSTCPALATQAFYHLNHTSSCFFCFSYFSNRVSHFCQGPVSDCDPPTYASHVAGTTGVYHHSWLNG
jgi:hypothetical protein